MNRTVTVVLVGGAYDGREILLTGRNAVLSTDLLTLAEVHGDPLRPQYTMVAYRWDGQVRGPAEAQRLWFHREPPAPAPAALECHGIDCCWACFRGRPTHPVHGSDCGCESSSDHGGS